MWHLMTYKVLLHIPYFQHPQESREFPHCFCEQETSVVHKVIDMKHVDLCNGFELSSNQRVGILHDVISMNSVDGKSRSFGRL